MSTLEPNLLKDISASTSQTEDYQSAPGFDETRPEDWPNAMKLDLYGSKDQKLLFSIEYPAEAPYGSVSFEGNTINLNMNGNTQSSGKEYFEVEMTEGYEDLDWAVDLDVVDPSSRKWKWKFAKKQS